MPTRPWEDFVATLIYALLPASYVELSPVVLKMIQQGYERDAGYKEVWNDEEASLMFFEHDELLLLR